MSNRQYPGRPYIQSGGYRGRPHFDPRGRGRERGGHVGGGFRGNGSHYMDNQQVRQEGYNDRVGRTVGSSSQAYHNPPPLSSQKKQMPHDNNIKAKGVVEETGSDTYRVTFKPREVSNRTDKKAYHHHKQQQNLSGKDTHSKSDARRDQSGKSEDRDFDERREPSKGDAGLLFGSSKNSGKEESNERNMINFANMVKSMPQEKKNNTSSSTTADENASRLRVDEHENESQVSDDDDYLVVLNDQSNILHQNCLDEEDGVIIPTNTDEPIPESKPIESNITTNSSITEKNGTKTIQSNDTVGTDIKLNEPTETSIEWEGDIHDLIGNNVDYGGEADGVDEIIEEQNKKEMESPKGALIEAINTKTSTGQVTYGNGESSKKKDIEYTKTRVSASSSNDRHIKLMNDDETVLIEEPQHGSKRDISIESFSVMMESNESLANPDIEREMMDHSEKEGYDEALIVDNNNTLQEEEKMKPQAHDDMDTSTGENENKIESGLTNEISEEREHDLEKTTNKHDSTEKDAIKIRGKEHTTKNVRPSPPKPSISQNKTTTKKEKVNTDRRTDNNREEIKKKKNIKKRIEKNLKVKEDDDKNDINMLIEEEEGEDNVIVTAKKNTSVERKKNIKKDKKDEFLEEADELCSLDDEEEMDEEEIKKSDKKYLKMSGMSASENDEDDSDAKTDDVNSDDDDDDDDSYYEDVKDFITSDSDENFPSDADSDIIDELETGTKKRKRESASDGGKGNQHDLEQSSQEEEDGDYISSDGDYYDEGDEDRHHTKKIARGPMMDTKDEDMLRDDTAKTLSLEEREQKIRSSVYDENLVANEVEKMKEEFKKRKEIATMAYEKLGYERDDVDKRLDINTREIIQALRTNHSKMRDDVERLYEAWNRRASKVGDKRGKMIFGEKELDSFIRSNDLVFNISDSRSFMCIFSMAIKMYIDMVIEYNTEHAHHIIDNMLKKKINSIAKERMANGTKEEKAYAQSQIEVDKLRRTEMNKLSGVTDRVKRLLYTYGIKIGRLFNFPDHPDMMKQSMYKVDGYRKRRLLSISRFYEASEKERFNNADRIEIRRLFSDGKLGDIEDFFVKKFKCKPSPLTIDERNEGGYAHLKSYEENFEKIMESYSDMISSNMVTGIMECVLENRTSPQGKLDDIIKAQIKAMEVPFLPHHPVYYCWAMFQNAKYINIVPDVSVARSLEDIDEDGIHGDGKPFFCMISGRVLKEGDKACIVNLIVSKRKELGAKDKGEHVAGYVCSEYINLVKSFYTMVKYKTAIYRSMRLIFEENEIRRCDRTNADKGKGYHPINIFRDIIENTEKDIWSMIIACHDDISNIHMSIVTSVIHAIASTSHVNRPDAYRIVHDNLKNKVELVPLIKRLCKESDAIDKKKMQKKNNKKQRKDKKTIRTGSHIQMRQK